MENREANDVQLSCANRLSLSVFVTLEKVFYRQGKFVATHPILVLFVTFVGCLICSLGLLNIHVENRPEKLWIPQDSDFVRTLDWKNKHYPDSYRMEMVIFQADNILQPVYLREMFALKEKLRTIVVEDSFGNNRTLDDVCYRVPALGGRAKERLQKIKSSFLGEEDSNPDFDWSQKIPRKVYCDFFAVLPRSCLSLSILDIWPSNGTLIEHLTQDDILRGINLATESATYAYPFNFTTLLGGVTRNSTGHIVSAKTCLHTWNMEVERADLESKNQMKLPSGMSVEISGALYQWEGKFIQTVLQRGKVDVHPTYSALPMAFRSFMEVSESTIFGDIKFILAGIFILSFYILLMLGKFNCVETRPVLIFFGMISVFLSVIASFGLCAGAGIIYGPIHSILPLILIGLGVDDMFIIVHTLELIENSHQEILSPKGPLIVKLEDKMAAVLSSAGTSITVTSLTDFLAFGIGSMTSLPALRSFCLYAAIGIISLYIMQITFFFAAFVLDQTRLQANRNGFLWCVKHRQWEFNQCSQKNFGRILFGQVYAKWLLKPASKVGVLVATVLLASACVWGTINLRQDFKITWFIPRSSYVAKFLSKIEHFYPEAGITGSVYIENLDLPRELPNLKRLIRSMEENPWISSIDSWYDPLIQYTINDSGIDLEIENVTSEIFSDAFAKFLFSPNGAKFQPNIYFTDELTCAERAPSIKACKFDYQHRLIEDRNEQIEAMDEIKLLVKKANFSEFSTCTAFMYSSWETNKLIVREMIQNLSLALAAVFIMTFLLIVNLKASIFVFLCVLLTLIEVMALMSWWDLTINTVTSINLVLCVGLSVDYSAHVALHFMKVRGSLNDRVMKTLSEVGPPVFNGAFSTFLSVVLLANSDSYVFLSFFKIFFGVFIFGIYNGLLFLPVLLSLIGPQSYLRDDQQRSGEGTSEPQEREALQLTNQS